MREDVKGWWKKAKQDFETAKYLFNGKKYEDAAFFCQQSIEKALKSLIIQKTNEFPKVHDLTFLAKLIDSPQHIIELCAKLNSAYITSRYPDSLQKYSKKECEELINNCNEVIKWIKKNLN